MTTIGSQEGRLRIRALGYLAAAERLARLENVLSAIEATYDPAELRLTPLFRDRLDFLQRELSANYLEQWGRSAKPVDDWDRMHAEALIRKAILNNMGQSAELALEMKALPRVRAPVAMFEVISSSLQGLYGVPETLTLVPWPRMNYGQEEAKRVLSAGSPGTHHVTLYFNESEFRNPLMWTMLGHEVGHIFITPSKSHPGPAVGATPELVAKAMNNVQHTPKSAACKTHWDLVWRWMPEFICDAFGCRVFGSAYAAAQAWFALGRSVVVSEGDQSHPPPVNRSSMARAMMPEDDLLSRVRDIFTLLQDAEREVAESQPVPDCFQWAQVYEAAWDAADATQTDLEPVVLEGTLAHLTKELHQGIPIGGTVRSEAERRQLHSECRAVLDRWNSLAEVELSQEWGTPIIDLDGSRAALVHEESRIRSALSDSPIKPIQIVNGGWLDKFQNLELRVNRVIDLFEGTAPTPSLEEINRICDDWCKYSVGLDALLLKSLEIGSVLRFYVR